MKREEFISKANKIYNNKYDYSKVKYINNKTKVEIICKIHGSFFKEPSSFLKGVECNICKKNKIRENEKEKFILKANKIYNNKYDYSKVKYINNKTKVEIICKTHGSFFQKPNDHLMKHECPSCSLEKNKDTFKLGKNKFIYKSNKIHRNKYDYSKVVYVNSRTAINIICPIHGSFFQKPHEHLRGHGCRLCNTHSKNEENIYYLLKDNNINFDSEKTFDDCIDKRKLPFDFYLPEHNTLIEYDGKQHYESIDFFGGEKAFIKRQLHDKMKNEYAKNKGISLIRIPYWKDEIKEVSSFLKNH